LERALLTGAVSLPTCYDDSPLTLWWHGTSAGATVSCAAMSPKHTQQRWWPSEVVSVGAGLGTAGECACTDPPTPGEARGGGEVKDIARPPPVGCGRNVRCCRDRL
jgi:hypothetical protein